MNIKFLMVGACVTLGLAASGQGKDGFLGQQAYAEMQRVSGQVDVLQTNFSELQDRIGRLEGNGQVQGIRQEIDSLKAAIAEIRRELQSQRGEIVRDLSGRLAKMQPPAPKPAAPAKTVMVTGPHLEYTVQSGDTLSLIAKAFNTTVRKIKDMNALSGDALRVGQKINVPKE